MSSSPPAVPSLSLASGSQFPVVGLGLWKAEKGKLAEYVYEAIKLGYRHFDSACDYGNEKESGEGIKRAIADGLVKREDLFITSKLWCTYHHREHVKPALERTLSDMQLDYLDLFLIHFPISLEFIPFDVKYPPEWALHGDAHSAKQTNASIRETWEAMVREHLSASHNQGHRQTQAVVMSILLMDDNTVSFCLYLCLCLSLCLMCVSVMLIGIVDEYRICQEYRYLQFQLSGCDGSVDLCEDSTCSTTD